MVGKGVMKGGTYLRGEGVRKGGTYLRCSFRVFVLRTACRFRVVAQDGLQFSRLLLRTACSFASLLRTACSFRVIAQDGSQFFVNVSGRQQFSRRCSGRPQFFVLLRTGAVDWGIDDRRWCR